MTNPEPQGKLPYVIVLAGTTREGRRYAKLAKLPKGRHRVVHSAKQIRHLRTAEIHELPSFARRPDRHGINAALRYTRGERLQVEMPRFDDRGELTERQLEVAYRYNAQLDLGALDQLEQVIEELNEEGRRRGAELREKREKRQAAETLDASKPGHEPPDAVDPFEVATKQDAPARSRRSRCKVCAALVLGDDDPAHDGPTHEAHEAELLGKPAPTPADFFGKR